MGIEGGVGVLVFRGFCCELIHLPFPSSTQAPFIGGLYQRFPEQYYTSSKPWIPDCCWQHIFDKLWTPLDTDVRSVCLAWNNQALHRRNASSLSVDSAPARLLDGRETVALELFYGSESEGTSERQSQEAKAERMAGRPIGQYRMHLMWWHLAPCVTRASCFLPGWNSWFLAGKCFTSSTWRTWRF